MQTGGEAPVSNHSKLRFLVVLLFAAFATAALVSADIGALAQNANSSTTGDESAQNSNANMMGGMRRGSRARRGRRGRRGRGRAASNAAAVSAAEQGSMIDPNGGAAAQSGDISGEKTDLSGTYAGHMTMMGGHEMSGEVTLTITGNTFTITGESMSHDGRVYAVTTRGYTGASFYFSDISNPATNTPVVATVRARKKGDSGLWLSPVPGTQTSMTFGTGGGGGGGGGRRGRRARRSEMMTTPPAEATGDASATDGAPAMGAASATGGGETGGKGGRRGSRRGRRRAPTTNTNSNTGDNSNATPPM